MGRGREGENTSGWYIELIIISEKEIAGEKGWKGGRGKQEKKEKRISIRTDRWEEISGRCRGLNEKEVRGTWQKGGGILK